MPDRQDLGHRKEFRSEAGPQLLILLGAEDAREDAEARAQGLQAPLFVEPQEIVGRRGMGRPVWR
ncbi:MAG: hypothetical protein ACRD1Z_22610, partial [Vicinamibacteria bacterium]